MPRLAGKTAVITGGSSGQGAAEARLFAAEGANVVIADIQDELGTALALEIGNQALFVHLDVTEERDWESGVGAVIDAFGSIDVLVNGAGIGSPSAIHHTDLKQYLADIAVDQVGVFLGMKAVAPVMFRARGGSIVNISSISGAAGTTNQIPYVAAKWAVRGMTKGAALEFARYGVRVNAVLPGLIKTPMTAGLPPDWFQNLVDSIPLARAGEATDVAQLVLFLASDESSYITGGDFVIDGGMSTGFDRPGYGFDLLNPPLDS